MAAILNVLIVGYYGFENAGDEAILRAIVSDLRALHPDIGITAVSGNPAGTSELHGIAAISWRDSLAVFDAVSEADLTIVGGGGIFHDYWGFDPNLFLTDRQSGIAFYTAPAVLAALQGKPVVLYAVGVGPLLSGHAKRFTRVACEAASAITVRDEGSKRLLESIGVSGDRVTVTADPVFSLSPEDAAFEEFMPTGMDLKKPLVAVSVRHWDVGVESAFWEREFAAGLDRFLANEGGTVFFLPFGRLSGTRENDQAVSERIQSLMRRRDRTAVISCNPGSVELLNLFGRCDLTVGMRLHALMFGALNRVPCVAVSYDPKVTSFMERIGSPDAIDIGSLEADVLARTMSDALARAGEFRTAVPDKLNALAGLARQNAAIALAAPGRGHGAAGYWPSPELSSLLVRGFRAQLDAGRSLQCELDSLTGVLSAVEADRDEGRRFLNNEKQVLARQLEEASSALALLEAEGDNLRVEIETLGRFQQSQNDAIASVEEDREALRKELEKARQFQTEQDESLSRVEDDRLALREELEKARQFHQTQEESLSKVEADRLALREELEKARQFHKAQEESLSRIEADRDELRGALEKAEQLRRENDASRGRHLEELEAERFALARRAGSIAKAIRLETDRDSISHKLRSIEEKLDRSEEKLRVERNARESAERELETSRASLRESTNARQNTAQAIREYRSRFDGELNVSVRGAARLLYSSERHDDPFIESHLDIRDAEGNVVPGYGWIFPMGDGRVNVGVGLLSTDRRWKGVNTSHLMEAFVEYAPASWGLRPETCLGPPTGGKLPMGLSIGPRSGANVILAGDAQEPSIRSTARASPMATKPAVWPPPPWDMRSAAREPGRSPIPPNCRPHTGRTTRWRAPSCA